MKADAQSCFETGEIIHDIDQCVSYWPLQSIMLTVRDRPNLYHLKGVIKDE